MFPGDSDSPSASSSPSSSSSEALRETLGALGKYGGEQENEDHPSSESVDLEQVGMEAVTEVAKRVSQEDENLRSDVAVPLPISPSTEGGEDEEENEDEPSAVLPKNNDENSEEEAREGREESVQEVVDAMQEVLENEEGRVTMEEVVGAQGEGGFGEERQAGSEKHVLPDFYVKKEDTPSPSSPSPPYPPLSPTASVTDDASSSPSDSSDSVNLPKEEEEMDSVGKEGSGDVNLDESDVRNDEVKTEDLEDDAPLLPERDESDAPVDSSAPSSADEEANKAKIAVDTASQAAESLSSSTLISRLFFYCL